MTDNKLVIDRMDRIHSEVSDIKADISEIKVDIAHHISRTDKLQDMVTPLYDQYISEKAVESYKKKQREELLYKLKLPAYIVAAMTAIGTAIAWLVRR